MKQSGTTFWRTILAVLVLAALASLVAAVLLDWNPWSLSGLGIDWQRQRIQGAHMQPPTIAVAFPGAIFTLFTTGLIVLFLFPERLALTARAFRRPWVHLARLTLLGLLAGLLIFVAALSASLTMTTFPLTIFLSIVLMLAILFGSVALAYRLGRFLLNHAGVPASPVLMLLLGEFLLFSIVSLPGIGMLALLFIAALGLGAAIRTRFGTGRPWSLISLLEEGKE